MLQYLNFKSTLRKDKIIESLKKWNPALLLPTAFSFIPGFTTFYFWSHEKTDGQIVCSEACQPPWTYKKCHLPNSDQQPESRCLPLVCIITEKYQIPWRPWLSFPAYLYLTSFHLFMCFLIKWFFHYFNYVEHYTQL